ncbi:RDD family protein [Mucilaginibacter calamicampi]|uniref:RDD family protein n=1 Tax=Mucilaginibacter calamicampi TaxID=1302352 RepID=A0ABW2YQF4_9SPHI
MEKEYYLLDGYEKTGPFTYHELVQNGLDVNTQLSTSMNDKLQFASEMPEFYDYFQSKGIYFPTGDNLANFGTRAVAFIIDYFPLYIVLELVAVNTGFIKLPTDLTLNKPFPQSIILFNLGFSVLFLLYRAIIESSPIKATIGKKICKLVVVDINGSAPSILQSLGRNLGVVMSIMLWVPFLTMLFNEHRQNWYDSLAKTYVVKTN